MKPITEPTVFIGRCLSCEPRKRTVHRQVCVPDQWGNGTPCVPMVWDIYDSERKCPRRMEGLFPIASAQRNRWLAHCVACRSQLEYVKLKHRRSDHPCDAACMRSSSGDCKCACDGANHGVYA